jgi:hypothetical protein
MPEASQISSFGYRSSVIQAEDIKRSEEILAGAISSAKDGLVVVETTWRGGREATSGTSRRRPEEVEHADGWRVVFFPWHDDFAYVTRNLRGLCEQTLRNFSNKPDLANYDGSFRQNLRCCCPRVEIVQGRRGPRSCSRQRWRATMAC